MAWLADGKKLHEPQQVTDATDAYRHDEDQIGRFLAECCQVDPRCEVRASQLYDLYSNWCRIGGEPVSTNNSFGRDLTARGYESTNRGGVKWRQGLGVQMVIPPDQQF